MNIYLRYFLMVMIILISAACCTKSDQVSVGKSNSIVVGKGPDALFLTPDENFLYVANVEDTFLSVIDTRTDEVVRTIDVVDYPWGFTRLGNSSLVAVSGWGRGISVIDFLRHKRLCARITTMRV